MNRYLRALVVVPVGALKMGFAKLFHPKSFHGPAFCMVSPHSEITLDGGGKLSIGSGLEDICQILTDSEVHGSKGMRELQLYSLII